MSLSLSLSLFLMPLEFCIQHDMMSHDDHRHLQPPLRDMIGKEYQFLKETHDIMMVLRLYLKSNDVLKGKLLTRLNELREKFTKSSFFARHELIGSSLLIIHDDHERIGVWMIDFAKAVPLPLGIKIDHVKPWILGNHEDGYLFGLNNLIRILEQLNFS